MTAEERLKQLQDFVIDLRQGKYNHILDYNYKNWTLKFKSYNPDHRRTYQRLYQRKYGPKYYAENYKSLLDRKSLWPKIFKPKQGDIS